MLYVVATPIGNLKDISLRALEILKSADLIACEDTRHTQILLNHYGIQASTTSYFQHNRLTKEKYLLGLLKEGKSVALVSDAGTPGILDPGYHLINLAIKNNIATTVIPGPTALIQALAASGKPSHKFIFAGFLPTRALARRNHLHKISALNYTIVFYESCHRIMSTLEDIMQIWPDRDIVCARELTKKFEEIKRGRAAELRDYFKKRKARGEFVVVV